MGHLTISMAIFNSYVNVYQRVIPIDKTFSHQVSVVPGGLRRRWKHRAGGQLPAASDGWSSHPIHRLVGGATRRAAEKKIIGCRSSHEKNHGPQDEIPLIYTNIWDFWEQKWIDLLGSIIWLVVWNIWIIFSHHIGNVIIPTDELIFFQRGGSTTNQLWYI